MVHLQAKTVPLNDCTTENLETYIALHPMGETEGQSKEAEKPIRV